MSSLEGEDGAEDFEDEEEEEDGKEEMTGALPRKVSDVPNIKVQPIPKYSSLFIFSPTNRLVFFSITLFCILINLSIVK